jgi:putative toxin-antitoxin system antitoxin component (TIGR02293 family)
MIFSAHKGVKPAVFYEFAETINMPEKNLAHIIHISARTISNYKDQQKVLEPVQSEHLLKLIALYDKGESIFGNVNEFSYWLNKPFWNSKEKPINWLITPGGIDLVVEELDRMVQGYAI